MDDAGPRGSADTLGAIWLAALSVVGLGIAAFLTSVHYAPGVGLPCPSTGVINCEAVLSSTYSVIPGTTLPITVPGMAYFLVSLGLALAQVRRPEVRRWRQLQAGWAGLGILTALYLVFVELVRLHEICLWCTSVHVVILLSLLTAVWRLGPPAAAERSPSAVR